MKKISFIYKDEKGEYNEELLWGKEQKNGLYEIDSIPFFVTGISCGDTVSVENDNDKLYFLELIKTSGNSTVNIIFFHDRNIFYILSSLEKLGCVWERLKDSRYYAVDIPFFINYQYVKEYLDSHVKDLDYRESCLAH